MITGTIPRGFCRGRRAPAENRINARRAITTREASFCKQLATRCANRSNAEIVEMLRE